MNLTLTGCRMWLAIVSLLLAPYSVLADPPSGPTQLLGIPLTDLPIPPVTRHTLIVTHAQGEWGRAIAPGLDSITRRFRRQHLPVAYLLEPNIPPVLGPWMTTDRAPTYALRSWVGDLGDGPDPAVSIPPELHLATGEVTLTGGFLGACLGTNVRSVIASHFAVTGQPLTIHMPMAAIYDAESYPRYETLLSAYRRQGQNRRQWLMSRILYRSSAPIINSEPGDLNIYTIRTYIDSVLVSTWGHGSRHIDINYSSPVEPVSRSRSRSGTAGVPR